MKIGQTQQFSTGAQYDEFRIGGTSLSSPLMAGIMAVAQQARGSRIGFANPLLYSLPSSALNDVQHIADLAVVRVDYFNAESFADRVQISVRTMDVTFTLHTAAGYDDVTGLGSPNANFVAAVASAR
jgi:subtilase family serine protease